MDPNTKDILEAVNFIKEKVEQLPRSSTRSPDPLHASLTEINRRLDTIEESYANPKGVTKEIDEIRDEVHAIQKHLGIERKIAA